MVTARNVADATNRVGRAHLWRACEMVLRGAPEGGRLYVETVVSRGRDDPFTGDNHLRTLPVRTVAEELEARGATVVARKVIEDKSPDASVGHRIGRLVVEWQA